MHAGEEDHARPGWTTSRRGQDSVEESIRMAEDRDKWRKYVHGVANHQIENRTQVDRYEKKHSPTHTHPDHQSSFINSVHLL